MFVDYRDWAAGLAADLVNTVGSISGSDFIADLESLRAWLEAHGMSDEVPTEADLAEAHSVRSKLRAVFWADSDEARATALNVLLDGARPRLTNHDGNWHLHYVDEGASLGERVGVLAAMGIAALITELGSDRLGLCSADDCKDVFVDTSRNRSRRYCADTCSTRMNVAAYRARKKVGSN